MNNLVLQSNNDLVASPEIKKQPEYSKMWLAKYTKATQSTYRSAVRQFVNFLNGGNLFEVSFLQFSEYHTFLIKKGYAQNTISLRINALKSLYSYLATHDLVDETLLKKMKNIKPKKPQYALTERLATKEEIVTLISAASNERDRLIIKCGVNLGLRISEIVGIRWENIRDGRLTVKGKGGKVRTVKLSDDMVASFETLKGDSPYLFAGRDKSTHLDRTVVHRMLKKVIACTTVNPALSAHWLRHFHAISSLEAGCDLNLLRESLGHSNINTTQKYLHTLQNQSSSDFVAY